LTLVKRFTLKGKEKKEKAVRKNTALVGKKS